MNKTIADKIINNHKLIRGGLSRHLLKKIINNQPIEKHILPDHVTLQQLEKIRVMYNEKSKIINQATPRNTVFYHIIKDLIPAFYWEELLDSKKTDRLITQIFSPRVSNLRPSLLSLLLGYVDAKLDIDLLRKYPCVQTLPFNIAQKTSVLLTKMDILYPQEDGMKLIINWLQQGLAGQTLTIFSPVCPDYSVERTSDPRYPFRHTFNTLGSGLGLIAQRLLKIFPVIEEYLESLGVKFQIVIGVADFEAFSESNLQRLKISQAEFLIRLEKSKIAFMDTCPSSYKISMISELCGGIKHWFEYLQLYQERFHRGDFGESEITHKILLNMVSKRKNLYSRWHGKKFTLTEYLPYILAQGAEYAAVGMIISQYNNCLILGADNDVMYPFYNIEQTFPAIYLKRYYC